MVRPRIARLGGARNRRAAWIGQSQHTGHLVERFARRVVDRAAQRPELERTDAMIQAAVPAADDQSHARKNVPAAGDLTGIDVGVQVVHGHQRLVQGQAQSLGRHQAHQQRTGQARRIGHRDGVHVVQRSPGTTQRLVDHRQNALDVRAGCDLRNHSPKPLVQLVLRSHNRAQHLQPVGDDGRRRLVASRFDRQDLHVSRSIVRASACHASWSHANFVIPPAAWAPSFPRPSSPAPSSPRP